MEKELKTIELFISEDDIDGLQAMSFVEFPAIEQNLFYFNKQKKNNYMMAKVDEEQGIIVSPALIPDKKIYRYDFITDEEFYVYFSRETVRKAAEMFLKENKQINVTEQHEVPVKGVYLVQSWIVENEHDALITKYGYSKKDIVPGTWAVSYKIENQDIKDKIKSGEINGLSIEAFFSERLDASNMRILNKIKELLEKTDKII